MFNTSFSFRQICVECMVGRTESTFLRISCPVPTCGTKPRNTRRGAPHEDSCSRILVGYKYTAKAKLVRPCGFRLHTQISCTTARKTHALSACLFSALRLYTAAQHVRHCNRHRTLNSRQQHHLAGLPFATTEEPPKEPVV